MLIERLYHPTDDEIFYHYCSPLAFHAILESGKIRFTDINMLNDTAEMHWGYSVFEEAAGNLIKTAEKSKKLGGLNKGFFDKVDEIIAPLQSRFHPFVSCFSREPDLLGQWRAYADNARGLLQRLRSVFRGYARGSEIWRDDQIAQRISSSVALSRDRK